jgi:hypothetical protein
MGIYTLKYTPAIKRHKNLTPQKYKSRKMSGNKLFGGFFL